MGNFQFRWKNYKDNRKYQRSETCLQEHLFRHILNPRHNGFLNDVSITFIDKTDPLDSFKLEDYWRRTLKTFALFGLNIEDSVWSIITVINVSVIIYIYLAFRSSCCFGLCLRIFGWITRGTAGTLRVGSPHGEIERWSLCFTLSLFYYLLISGFSEVVLAYFVLRWVCCKMWWTACLLSYCYYCLYLFKLLLSIVSMYKPLYWFGVQIGVLVST